VNSTIRPTNLGRIRIGAAIKLKRVMTVKAVARLIECPTPIYTEKLTACKRSGKKMIEPTRTT